ncbi:NlpC/P60 family protein [Frigidibacter sp. ROC022]|uniref:NlpC/P60 family protein n=1 Tax=Frigidibacter sp. ROC022 TaxID=2971796 RepID=UPI00215A536B|nr:NlpC/P60 family protein [Frigidibacter sp. ROC022]MCR8723635.1 NlpC/P60 family protein [Frigidibacter sp. ROC022]
MRRAEIVALARGWIGTPYVHQGSTRGAGADCLGLVRGIWREALGAEPATVPAYTEDWSEAGRDERLWSAARTHLIPREGLAPGAVLLFRMRAGGVAKHLGILAETGPRPSFIHAYSGHRVTESPLSAPWARRIVACFDFPARSC